MKNVKIWKKIVITALSVFMLTEPAMAKADSIVPYDSYNYDYWDNIVFTPAPYIPENSVSGTTLGVGSFLNPQDLCVSPSGEVYIADTGNNRIVVVDNSLTKFLRVIDSFERDGQTDTFKSPYGVCVSENGQLYIADTENRRIVVLEADDLSFVKIIDNPTSDVLEEDFVFAPLKVTVDYADRVY